MKKSRGGSLKIYREESLTETQQKFLNKCLDRGIALKFVEGVSEESQRRIIEKS